MKIKQFMLPAFILMLSVFFSCGDVDALSDENHVADFKVSLVQPQDIQLGFIEIVDDSDDLNEIKINVIYGVEKFPMKFHANVTFRDKIDVVIGVDFSKEVELKSLDDKLTFTVVALSGLPRTYTIRAVADDFMLPEQIGFDIKSVSPEDSQLENTAYIDGTTMRITVVDPVFPLKLIPEFQVDNRKVAFHGFRNGVTELVFNSTDDVQTIAIEDVVNGTIHDVTVRLDVSLSGPEGFEVATFKINSFSSTFAAADINIVSDPESNDQPGEVIIVLSDPGSCPVTMNYTMTISRNATASIARSGNFTFGNLNEVKTFTIQHTDGRVKEWRVGFAGFTPQLKNNNMSQWEDEPSWTKNGPLFPIPKGVEGAPYWSNANMYALGGIVKVDNTRMKEIASGDYAAELSTNETFGQMAAGSLFLGWFNSSNPTVGMDDPTSMTYQGIPFAASKRIKGVMVDISYASGTSDSGDTGSIAVELIKQRPNTLKYVYHGLGQKQDSQGNYLPHANNTADLVVRGHIVVGNIAEGQTAANGDTVTKRLVSGVWTKNVMIDIDYSGVTDESYTHFNFICSSSSKGDFFKGEVGSTLVIDNIRIVYED